MAKLLRIVNDTNVWLSALYFNGKEAEVVHRIEENGLISITSDFILQELKEKMIAKFKTPPYAANAIISYIMSISQMVNLRGEDFGLRDPDDNKVLETAVAGKCDYLITGDKDLLILGQFDNIKIITAGQLLNKYEI